MHVVSLPPFALFPPAHVRKHIPPLEWEALIDSWSSLAQSYLSLSSQAFCSTARDENNQLFKFLATMFKQDGSGAVKPRPSIGELQLRRLSFLLVQRVADECEAIPSLIHDPSFLGDLCLFYNGGTACRSLMEKLWSCHALESSASMLENKSTVSSSLCKVHETGSTDLECTLLGLISILRVSPSYGRFLMQGSDFLDALLNAWDEGSRALQGKIVTIMYYALMSLLHGGNSTISILLDHLFTLRAHNGGQKQRIRASLLSDLVLRTPILQRLQNNTTISNIGRSNTILRSLESVKLASLSSHLRPNRQIRNKGKEKKAGNGELNVHRMSLVTEVQDLFPDSNSSAILKLLNRYEDDTEKVIAYLLDNPRLAAGTQSSDSRKAFGLKANSMDLAPSAQPRNLAVRGPSSDLPSHPNYFDNDELQVASGNLHIGRKDNDLEPFSSQNKAAILSALASFDSDSDERDDTYDLQDVGGIIDNAMDAEAEVNNNEEALYSAWKSVPEVFARDAATRKGKARSALRSDTGMTNEAIEGWALMLERNPRRQVKLEAEYASFRGQQAELASTAWRATSDHERDVNEAADVATNVIGGNARGVEGVRGRGTTIRRQGNVTRNASDRGTQLARHRKDVNKSSRANHNRREQRARKFARAGLPVDGDQTL